MQSRLKRVARWLLLGLALGFMAWISMGTPPSEVPTPPTDESASGDEKLKIEQLRPGEVTPGGAVVVTVSGLANDGTALSAELDKQAAQVLDRAGDRVVVRVPPGLGVGRAKLRITEGERRSKSRDVWVKPVVQHTLTLDLVGGFALLVLGLRTLSRALRRYAGRGLRQLLERIAERRLAGFAVGTLVGAITQSPVTAVGVLVGLVESNLVGWSAAIAALLGAELGAAALGILFPFGASSGALVIVALGVGWVALAQDSRTRELSKAILGLGFLFYGVQLLRLGFQPLFADPELVRYTSYFRQPGIAGIAVAAGVGALFALLVPAPGPICAAVMGLGESTGLIGVRESLALLAGLPLGAGLWALVVSWPFGGNPRRFGYGQFAIQCLVSLGLIATLPAWTWLADALVPGAPQAPDYASRIVYPELTRHVAVGLILSHAAWLLAGCLPLPLLASWVERRRIRLPERRQKARGQEGDLVQLVPICDAFSHALSDCLQMLLTGDRGLSTRIEDALVGARGELFDALMRAEHGRAARKVGTRSADWGIVGEEAGGTEAVALRLSSALHSLRSLRRAIELGIEQDQRLEPVLLDALSELHRHVKIALANLRQVLMTGSAAQLEEARATEIRTNAQEAQVRQLLLHHDSEAFNPPWKPVQRRVATTLFVAGAAGAYEELGNHLFLAYEAVSDLQDVDY